MRPCGEGGQRVDAPSLPIFYPPPPSPPQNILEHSANTAVGLLRNGTALLVTTDGFDGCSGFDPTCGANAFTLAYLMKDYFNVSSAMGMDQGGSTTMWVQGRGYVSNPGQGVRDIFSALFVEEVQ